jgi:cytochrome c biogenesis protein CcmG/thiol:disulfide interchange protein DsbE
VALGAGRAPHLYLFFASWDQQVLDLRGDLRRLLAYQAAARTRHLPSLIALDEASLEPGPGALTSFLATLSGPLSYPVAIDRSGRIADGYEVQDEPWLVLTSASGRILWYYDVSTGGMPSTTAIIRQVRAGLVRSPQAPSTAAVTAQLAGSPPSLARLHDQADRVVGDQSALVRRIHALRGYPIVINVWGSWCAPCVAEFGLFGTASAQYGRRVAFLGADIGDSASDAQSFMRQHPVSYPSYQTSPGRITAIVPQGLEGTPMTIFINRQGKVVHTHAGQYPVQGELDSDIATYLLNP